MPTADRVVVIPDSVLMVPGTTACGGPGFHVGWSLFRRVIQFGIFKILCATKSLRSIWTCNTKEHNHVTN
jgi:hypothetical protein